MVKSVYRASAPLLKTLIQLFPQSFLKCGQAVIAELFKKNHFSFEYFFVVQEYYQLGGELDSFHILWLEVACNRKPQKEFKEGFKLLSPSQQRILYDSAFAHTNPFIYESTDTLIDPNLFSINLMWINKSKIPAEQEFLFGEGSTHEERFLDFNTKFIKPISKWARKNPDSPLNIWIDSQMATQKAIQNSQLVLLEELKDLPGMKIAFRDVRSLDVVQAYAEVFSEKFPVYFRVDLLRAIAADHVLRAKETQFFVYGDIDMKPLSRKKLFDKRTMAFLDDFGFVLAKGGMLGFENGFQILNGENQPFMKSHRYVIIDLSIDMALEDPRAIKEQQIYDTYLSMIAHFLHEDGRYGKLDIKKKADPKFFRYDVFSKTSFSNFCFPKRNRLAYLQEIIPCKPVRLPTSHFIFGKSAQG